MTKLTAFQVFGAGIIGWLSVHAQPLPTGRVVGSWDDSVLGCIVSIEEKSGRFTEVQACKLVPNELLRRTLVKTGKNSFRVDVRPRKSWYYRIGSSNDLEVWDAEGPVRTLASRGAQSGGQVAETKKTELVISALGIQSKRSGDCDQMAEMAQDVAKLRDAAVPLASVERRLRRDVSEADELAQALIVARVVYRTVGTPQQLKEAILKKCS